MQGCLLSIDQSTQGTKALVIREDGRVLAKSALPHRQIINGAGWVSHDLNEIFENVLTAGRQAVDTADISLKSLVGIALTNQRETTAAWDRISGRPLAEAVVWQCTRADVICQEIEKCGRIGGRADGDTSPVSVNEIFLRTGLKLSPYYPAAKMAWLLREISEVREAEKTGTLALGTVDAYLINRLTAGEVFATDTSNASRTQLFDLERMTWDADILSLFGIPGEFLPEVRESDGVFGKTDLGGFLPEPIPILASLGDSHAALFGHGCTEPGDIKVTYGTGSSIMFNTGEHIVRSESGLSSSVAWTRNGKTQYVLEGNVHYAGAVISWLKDEVGLINDSAETEALCRAAAAEDRTYLVPAFTGLGAPWWASHARATLCGMGRQTGRAEIVRAAVESIAYQIRDVIEAMRADTGRSISCVHADGGPTVNGYLMQFQSDILEAGVAIPEVSDQSAVGVALMAGLKAGLWSESDVMKMTKPTKTFFPHMDKKERLIRLAGWEEAVRRVIERL